MDTPKCRLCDTELPRGSETCPKCGREIDKKGLEKYYRDRERADWKGQHRAGVPADAYRSGVFVQTYQTEAEYQRHAAQLAALGWTVSNVVQSKPNAGCLRIVLLWWLTLLFPPKPQLVVTYHFKKPDQQQVVAADSAAASPVAPQRACKNCGAIIPSSMRFCSECGAEQVVPAAHFPWVETSTCSSCGREIPSGTKFCPNCGAQRPDDAESTS